MDIYKKQEHTEEDIKFLQAAQTTLLNGEKLFHPEKDKTSHIEYAMGYVLGVLGKYENALTFIELGHTEDGYYIAFFMPDLKELFPGFDLDSLPEN